MLVLASPAFAETGGFGYVNWSDVKSLPGQGTSPHGGYATGTVKCAVCHAVHQAEAGVGNPGAQMLLQSSVADACNFCHLDTATGYTLVYGGDAANYSGTDLNNAHNSYADGLGAEQGITCSKCHQVHAADVAMTSNPILTQALLRGDKTFDEPPLDPNYDPQIKEPLLTDNKEVALTKWCAGCHFTMGGTVSYYADGYDGGSHIMTTATATYGNTNSSYSGRVAWKNSTYCMSCHSNEYNVAGRWPHMTNGMRFLDSAASASGVATGAVDAREDGVCLRCHRDGAPATAGVGLAF